MDRPHATVTGGDTHAANGGTRAQGPQDLLPRHVIEEYSHRSQVVRCECGWTGSSASAGAVPSDWKRHVAEFKTPKP